MTREEQVGISDLRERFARMEADQTNTNHHLERIEKSLDSMNTAVNELHDVHMKAKGARWALGASIPVVSGVVGWLAAHFPK